VKLGYFNTRCGKYILDSVEILEEMLRKDDIAIMKDSSFGQKG
jgi:hypothetical protein